MTKEKRKNNQKTKHCKQRGKEKIVVITITQFFLQLSTILALFAMVFQYVHEVLSILTQKVYWQKLRRPRTYSNDGSSYTLKPQAPVQTYRKNQYIRSVKRIHQQKERCQDPECISGHGSMIGSSCNMSLPRLSTICPRNRDPFLYSNNYIKWVTTSWTNHT